MSNSLFPSPYWLGGNVPSAGQRANMPHDYVSLDSNWGTGSGHTTPTVVLPPGYSPEMKVAGQKYMDNLQALYRDKFGLDVKPNFRYSGQPGVRGRRNTVHLEPGAVHHKEFTDWAQSPEGLAWRADNIRNTFGAVQGAQIGNPHGGKGGRDPGAVYGNISEVGLANQLLGEIAKNPERGATPGAPGSIIPNLPERKPVFRKPDGTVSDFNMMKPGDTITAAEFAQWLPEVSEAPAVESQDIFHERQTDGGGIPLPTQKPRMPLEAPQQAAGDPYDSVGGYVPPSAPVAPEAVQGAPQQLEEIIAGGNPYDSVGRENVPVTGLTPQTVQAAGAPTLPAVGAPMAPEAAAPQTIPTMMVPDARLVRQGVLPGAPRSPVPPAPVASPHRQYIKQGVGYPDGLIDRPQAGGGLVPQQAQALNAMFQAGELPDWALDAFGFNFGE